jgi:hypothetical protein
MKNDNFIIYSVIWNPDTNSVDKVVLEHKESGKRTVLISKIIVEKSVNKIYKIYNQKYTRWVKQDVGNVMKSVMVNIMPHKPKIEDFVLFLLKQFTERR